MFGSGLVVLFGIAIQLSPPVLLMVMPIAVFEMLFAGWLIVKGFNASALAPARSKSEPHALPSVA